VGAKYKDGALEVKGTLLSVNLTYVKRTDTILGPGFFGQYRVQEAEMNVPGPFPARHHLSQAECGP
jgi:hypothetical protein